MIEKPLDDICASCLTSSSSAESGHHIVCKTQNFSAASHPVSSPVFARLSLLRLRRPSVRFHPAYALRQLTCAALVGIVAVPGSAGATDITDKAFLVQTPQAGAADTPTSRNDVTFSIDEPLSAETTRRVRAVSATGVHTPGLRERLQYMADRASEVAVQAMTAIGIHYRYGGSNPDRGLDCSGLVKYVFHEAWGMVLPRTASEMSREGTRIDRHDLKMGDLIFFKTTRRSFSHVGIYMGDDKFIHAPSTGGTVRIDDMTAQYWSSRYNGARRIEAPAGDAGFVSLQQSAAAARGMPAQEIDESNSALR